MNKNECITYFKIIGDFEPDVVSQRLGLTPDNQWRKGDKRRDGSPQEWAMWQFGQCDEYAWQTGEQMQKTIAPLLSKAAELQAIRQEFEVEFVLQIVPSLYADQPTPNVAPSMAVIDFCHQTRTKIDVDMYLINN
ncbi:DUF4279 domain-containing protein [Capnocytophaga sp.]|uniref:DUF4279 domain-containing protein n=1 Tax=Capnocytophaga sp. TaxID=44737 RepID=UPI0026DCB8F6|nr:DUF4279 domain-containing protein [Capnocytophaga sp.]MDO5104271.1 DUF4279 domain-containing protein [Capnocytophaga sp.]